MSVNLPDNVERRLEIGLRTGEASDRLVALGMANQADEDGGHQSEFGLRVAEIFLDQLGLALQPGDRSINMRQWSHYGTPQDAAIVREVSRAVGDQVGVRTVLHEFIGKTLSQKHSLVLVNGKNVARIPEELNPLEPFFIAQEYANNKSRLNFQRTLKAVRGVELDGVQLDGEWLDTLAKIKDLDER